MSLCPSLHCTGQKLHLYEMLSPLVRLCKHVCADFLLVTYNFSFYKIICTVRLVGKLTEMPQFIFIICFIYI